jgi:ubiquitin-conjugating enzyme E2 W
MQARCSQRLKKEAEDIQKNYAGVLDLHIKDDSMRVWHIKFTGAEGTVYAGETYTLQFKFNSEYPIDSPEVIFVGTPPEHEHIYSNGFICLSILYSDWSPALKASSVCMSIISMMSSAAKKQKPPNDSTSGLRHYSSPK